MVHTTDEMKRHLDRMTAGQRDIIVKLYNKVWDCEGAGMPEKHWCESCKSTWDRFYELFVRFEFLNAQHEQIHRKNTSTHPGFFGYDHN